MNKIATLVFAAVATLGSVQAMAAGEESFNRTQLATPVTPSTLTRAEVQAEYQRARAAGEVQYLNRFTFPAEQRAESKLTRAEVIAEYIRARDAGEVGNTNFDWASPHQHRGM